MLVKGKLSKAVDLVRRGYKKPPHVIARWLWSKALERIAANRFPKLVARLTVGKAARRLGYSSPNDVFAAALESPPFPVFHHHKASILSTLSEQARTTIITRAKSAMERRVQFLGSAEVTLGTPIDWATDFKSGVSWAMEPSQGLEVLDLDRFSDIKIPWELSRLQWLLPVGQAYMITGDESYARFARDIINEWFDANPVCNGPNWICAMDVSMRAMSIAWLFYACQQSDSWNDEKFRSVLLVQLYLHAEFVLEYLEWSDIAGNHLTTDLAGLVIIGLFLGNRGRAKTWVNKGWQLLEQQFPLQVPEDGVCREASVPYHRLVAELFLLPALARRTCDLPVSDEYWQRLAKMADFTAAYTRTDGSVPIWGDADDGRAMPLGTQGLNDHRYLIETLRNLQAPPRYPEWDETLWWLGPGDNDTAEDKTPTSSAFEDAGAFILRNQDTHVFIDAGPVGMAGRGGHGHNDCLSFEAVISGTPVIVDPGAYVYSADWRARNRFRGTAAHNTPFIDNVEINTMPRDDWLWYLENDAVPEIRELKFTDTEDVLTAAHSGYAKLDSPITPVRTIRLTKETNLLEIHDRFEGAGEHKIQVTYTFAPGIEIRSETSETWSIQYKNQKFTFWIHCPEDWSSDVCDAEYSPSYGVIHKTKSLTFLRNGKPKSLCVSLMPI